MMKGAKCKSCNNAYDLLDHKPRNLPCGHTICLKCCNITAPQDDVNITCPNDSK